MVSLMKPIAFVGRTLLLLLALLLPLSLGAQTIRVEVPQTVEQGTPFQLSYTYSGSEDFEQVCRCSMAQHVSR